VYVHKRSCYWLRLPPAPLKPLRLTVLVGVVLIRPVVINVVLVVHTLGMLLRVALGPLAVKPVLSLGLRKLVNLNLSVPMMGQESGQDILRRQRSLLAALWRIGETQACLRKMVSMHHASKHA
jgi:hypothetical protein